VKEAEKKTETEKPVKAKELKEQKVNHPLPPFESVRTLIIAAHRFQRGTKRKSTGALLSDSEEVEEDSAPPKSKYKYKPQPIKANPRKATLRAREEGRYFLFG
jgi:hypothetical protein